MFEQASQKIGAIPHKGAGCTGKPDNAVLEGKPDPNNILTGDDLKPAAPRAH